MFRRFAIAAVVTALLLLGSWWALDSGPAPAPLPVGESGAPAGSVALEVTAPSTAATDTVADAETDGDPAPVPETAAPAILELDASEVDLEAGDRVLAGQVLDPWGGPAPGAEVLLTRVQWPEDIDNEGGARLKRLLDSRDGSIAFRDDVQGALAAQVKIRTDPEGRFEFRGVGPEDYLIAARSSGTLLTPSGVLLAPAEGATDPAIVVQLIEALTIFGWVETVDGRRPEQGTVTLTAVLAESTEVWTELRLGLDELTLHVLNPVSAEQPLGESGAFEFTGLSDLLYRVRVTAAPLAMTEVLSEASDDEPVVLVVADGALLTGQVLDGDGEPVAGVKVALDLDRGGPVAAALRLGEWQPSTTTDAAGLFELEGLPPGSYRLRARAPGYRPTRIEGLYLESGEQQLVEVRLEPGRVLQGRVLSAVDGEPVARAQVRARPVGGRRRWRWPHRVRSDASGSFRLDTLTEGRFELQVRHAEHVPYSVELEITAAPAEPLEIVLEIGFEVYGRVVGPDDEPLVDARVSTWSREHGGRSARSDENGEFVIAGLQAGAHHFSVRALGLGQYRERIATDTPDLGDIQLLPAIALEGVVLGPDGLPLAGASVRARGVAAPDATPAERRRWRPRARGGLSDADGGFRIELPDAEGWWQLQASVPHLRPLPVDPVEILGSDITGLVLRFSWGGIIRGSVLDAESAAPVAGAQVMVRSARPRGAGRQRAAAGQGGRRSGSVRVLATGAYEITGLDPGQYNVQVRAPGYATGVRDGLAVAEDTVVAVDLFLEPERVLLGQVVDARGAPLAGARVVVERGARGRPRATTQLDGRFEIGGLGGSALTVRVMAPDHVPWRGGDVLAAQAALLVALDRAVSLEGRITDGDTGEPIAGARIRLSPREAPEEAGRLRAGWGKATAAEDGAFLIEGVAAAVHWLRVEAQDYVTVARESVRLPLVEELVIEMHRGGRLGGRVRGPEGRGLGNVDVRMLRVVQDPKTRKWRPVNSRPVARERTGGNGRFMANGLPDGHYRLELRHADYQPLVVERVQVRVGGTVPSVRRSLRSGAELSGRVFGADGRGVEQGFARLRGPRGVDRWRVPVDREGRFRIRGIPAGDYQLDFLPGRGQGSRARVAVQLGDRERLRQDLHLGS